MIPLVKMRPLVRIGSFDLPEPSEYSSTTSTVVDSARNAQGVMIGAVIRDGLAKIECTWKFISASDWASILAQFDMKRGGSFFNNVTFFNQDINGWETREMYVSDRTANIFLRDKYGNIRGYTGARISLIEV